MDYIRHIFSSYRTAYRSDPIKLSSMYKSRGQAYSLETVVYASRNNYQMAVL